MKIDLYRNSDDGSWDLFIDNKLRVSRESWAIVSGIRDRLNHPKLQFPYSELDEIVENIQCAPKMN